MVTLIEAEIDAFFILVNGKRADLGVVRETGKRAYLRAHADGVWNDDLPALPKCDRPP